MKKIVKPLAALMLVSVLSLSMLTGCGEKGKVGKYLEPKQSTQEKAVPKKANPDSIPDEARKMVEKEEGMMMAEGIALRDIITKLGEEMGITMPQRLEEKDLQDILGLKAEDVEEYYGEYSSVGTSADHIIGIKAKKGKAPQVRAAMESRKEEIIKKFAEYLPEELEKAQCGKIIEKGDYLFLVIAGGPEEDCSDRSEKAERIIEESFSGSTQGK